MDAAIRTAMAGLLFERGLDMTFDDVAAQAGVGRTTVFRRYPTKKDLIVEAFSQVSIERFTSADTGSLRGDLHTTLSQIMQVFSDPRIRMLMRQALGEACRDPAFIDLFRAVLGRRLELITVLIDRAVSRGELPAATSPLLIADLISGIIAIRVAVDTPLPGPDELTALVDGLLFGFAGTK
ncbi:TetR/AcrR family transcriptional regulator [Nonomuraea sp. MG754425]|uniref:TetR/AcrR family transcriptional regulator n=1 Tax=Nonomuraea sp. MG754425 TaxID=2570319 RepID=UPI001F38E9C9|nr:TetR/AcrR family transcriptional regulator [Nonomuraea sp. MG754425]